ncbi:PhoH family protein [Flavobacterium sp. xlx-214]|nr:PhoH family protein [Flavobacterium sp. xlx-221]QMI82389.1 PhoH family protein [Flavobacterium sp. xlx-214]
MRILEGVEGIGFVFLDDKDIVRHRLVKKIVEAYKKVETANEFASHQNYYNNTNRGNETENPTS